YDPGASGIRPSAATASSTVRLVAVGGPSAAVPPAVSEPGTATVPAVTGDAVIAGPLTGGDRGSLSGTDGVPGLVATSVKVVSAVNVPAGSRYDVSGPVQIGVAPAPAYSANELPLLIHSNWIADPLANSPSGSVPVAAEADVAMKSSR